MREVEGKLKKWIAENVKTREEANALIKSLLMETFILDARETHLYNLITELRETFSIDERDYDEAREKGVELKKCFEEWLVKEIERDNERRWVTW